MCELFGLSCNKPVSVKFTWRGFLKRGRKHRDGWGIAFYPDGRSACIIKEPKPSVASPMASFLKSTDLVRSKVVISHVRKASKGSITYSNTHPFVRELFGREWVFAHNGTLRGQLPEPRFYEPVGETDSERAFCVIMDRLRELGKDANHDEIRRVIEATAKEFSELGGFNFLMSDGERLYAFWSGHTSLYYLVRVPPHQEIARLKDEDFEIDLSELKGPDEMAVLVATTPLTDEHWTHFPRRKLLVFKNGLLELSEKARRVLAFIRRAPHRVAIRNIATGTGLGLEEATKIVLELKSLGLLKQDRRDVVGPEHPDATYFTEPRVRAFIDVMLSCSE